MSFEDFGRAMDELTDHIAETATTSMRQLSRAVQRLSRPHVAAEGRRLSEDLCTEGYDVVERSAVRVERVPAATTDGEAAHVRYHDGSEWSDVTRYDLDAIERSLGELR